MLKNKQTKKKHLSSIVKVAREIIGMQQLSLADDRQV